MCVSGESNKRNREYPLLMFLQQTCQVFVIGRTESKRKYREGREVKRDVRLLCLLDPLKKADSSCACVCICSSVCGFVWVRSSTQIVRGRILKNKKTVSECQTAILEY